MTTASATRIAFASSIGTAIEFYDFYIYGLAVAMVIGPVFFPSSDSTVQSLNAFLTFGINMSRSYFLRATQYGDENWIL